VHLHAFLDAVQSLVLFEEVEDELEAVPPDLVDEVLEETHQEVVDVRDQVYTRPLQLLGVPHHGLGLQLLEGVGACSHQ
jgi:hypothetical protein